MKKNLFKTTLAAAYLCVFTVSCGSSGGGDTSGLVPDCDTMGEQIDLPTEITHDSFLDSDCTYRLTDTTFVVNGANLEIEAGTLIQGEIGQAALVITQNGTIEAIGTSADPIVFTSSQPVDSRMAGDWGGIVLLGRAKINGGINACTGTLGDCEDNIEGLAGTPDEGLFGGNDDFHYCGTMQYVRIEFAGFEITAGSGNELNGLTVGGCGSMTDLSYIQVHRGLDDGVEFFGGTASIDHFVVTGPDDDGLDWDQGWTGSATHFIVHHFVPGSSDPRGIEADNRDGANDALPRSNPTVTFGTIIGVTGTDQGIMLRRGTAGSLSDLIVAGFESGLDIDQAATAALWPTTLSVDDTFFFDNGVTYDADDDGIDEPALGGDVARNNDDETDPDFGDISGAVDDLSTPDYTSDITTAGAFGSDNTNWLANWTDYPVD